MAANNTGPLSESQAERQLKQMMDFLKIEAKEKADEIRIKAEHDYNMEKQMRVQQAKVKLRERMQRLEQERLTQQRVAASKAASVQKSKILRSQESLMQSLRHDTQKELSNWASSHAEEYKKLVARLIEQGIERVTHREHGSKTLSVRCRKVDQAIVNDALPMALKSFHEKHKASEAKNLEAAKNRGGRVDTFAPLTVEASIDKNSFLDDRSPGGVVVTAHEGRVVCDNTLSKRLELAEQSLTPVLRHMLFPSLRTSKNEADNVGEVDLLA